MPALPYVSINMAMSLDGKATTSSGEPSLFTGPRDKRLLVELRARADAVMAGGGTVAEDGMTLGIPDRSLCRRRARRGLPAQPLRVIVSGTLRSLKPGLKVFRNRMSPIVIFCSRAASKSSKARFASLASVVVCGGRRVDLRRALRILATRFGVRHLHVEGGPTLNGALFDEGLVNELDLTLAGRVFGGRDAPTICAGRGVARVRDGLNMHLASLSLVGNECYLKYVRRGKQAGQKRKKTGF